MADEVCALCAKWANAKHTEIHTQIDLSNGKSATWRKSRKTKLKINKIIERVDFHLEAETSTVISWLQSKRSKPIKWMRILINCRKWIGRCSCFAFSSLLSVAQQFSHEETVIHNDIVSYWKSRKIQCGKSEQCFQVIYRVASKYKTCAKQK